MAKIGPSSRKASSEKVLIVGGNVEFLGTLKEGLEKTGLFDVIIAEDDLQAVEALFAHPVSVVVIDINTPSTDCLDTIAYLTQAHRSTPLVLLTDYGKPWFRRKQGKNEFLYYLSKPFEIKELASAIFVGVRLSKDGYLSGGISVSSLLPLMEAQHKTGRMEVKVGNMKAYLYFRRGRLVDAYCPGLDSETAAREVSKWEGVAVGFSELPENRSRSRVETELMELADAIWTGNTPDCEQTVTESPTLAAAVGLSVPGPEQVSIVDTLRQYASSFQNISGFLALVVTGADDDVLLRQVVDERIDIERLAAHLRPVWPPLSATLEACGLPNISALEFETPDGIVFLVQAPSRATGTCQLTVLTSCFADRETTKTHMQKFLSVIEKIEAGDARRSS